MHTVLPPYMHYSSPLGPSMATLLLLVAIHP